MAKAAKTGRLSSGFKWQQVKKVVVSQRIWPTRSKYIKEKSAWDKFKQTFAISGGKMFKLKSKQLFKKSGDRDAQELK